MMLYAWWIWRTPLPIIPGSVPTLLSRPEIGHLVLQMMLPHTTYLYVGGWHEDCNDTQSFRTAGNGRR